MELKTKTEIQRQRKNKEPRSDFFHHVRVLCPRFFGTLKLLNSELGKIGA